MSEKRTKMIQQEVELMKKFAFQLKSLFCQDLMTIEISEIPCIGIFQDLQK